MSLQKSSKNIGNPFKVGDKFIVRANPTETNSAFIGKECVVIELSGDSIRFKCEEIPNKNTGYWHASDYQFKDFIRYEVYDSPLYKAMNE